ncbi:MAG: alpha/beta fold hydrolase [Bacteroidia bacterium]
MKLTEDKITINGLSINYVSAGSGAPIIFMHNGGGFWQSWKKQLEHFSATHTVYGIDWPGFGESEPPGGIIPLQLLTDTLKGFIELKNLQHVTLIGNCIGGSAALHFANNFPEKVNKLIIFNVCPGDLVVRFPPFRPIVRNLHRNKYLKKGLGGFVRFAFTKTFLRKRFPAILFAINHNREDELFQKYIVKNKTEKQNESRINLLLAASTYRLEKFAVQQTNFPHILVWGEENSVISLKRHGYEFNKMLRSDKFITIPGGGHLCMYEKSNEINEIISNYLNSK